jgi:hypothetical protein
VAGISRRARNRVVVVPLTVIVEHENRRIPLTPPTAQAGSGLIPVRK